MVQASRDHQVRFSITVRQTPAITRAVELVSEGAWLPIDYTVNGETWVADTPYRGHCLMVRRTKLHDPRPALFPDYRYHAFITDRDGGAISLDVDHCRRAVVELAICDLKEGSGLEHCPSRDFNANSAWAVLASIAQNLVHWVGALGLGFTGSLVAKAIRSNFIALPVVSRTTHEFDSCTCRPTGPGPRSAASASRVWSNYRTDRTVSRSPAVRPATSSANKFQTLSNR